MSKQKKSTVKISNYDPKQNIENTASKEFNKEWSEKSDGEKKDFLKKIYEQGNEVTENIFYSKLTNGGEIKKDENYGIDNNYFSADKENQIDPNNLKGNQPNDKIDKQLADKYNDMTPEEKAKYDYIIRADNKNNEVKRSDTKQPAPTEKAPKKSWWGKIKEKLMGNKKSETPKKGSQNQAQNSAKGSSSDLLGQINAMEENEKNQSQGDSIQPITKELLLDKNNKGNAKKGKSLAEKLARDHNKGDLFNQIERAEKETPENNNTKRDARKKVNLSTNDLTGYENINETLAGIEKGHQSDYHHKRSSAMLRGDKEILNQMKNDQNTYKAYTGNDVKQDFSINRSDSMSSTLFSDIARSSVYQKQSGVTTAAPVTPNIKTQDQGKGQGQTKEGGRT